MFILKNPEQPFGVKMNDTPLAIIATPEKEQMESVTDVCNACHVKYVCVESFEQLIEHVQLSQYTFLIFSDLLTEKNLFDQLLLIRNRTAYKYLPVIALCTNDPEYNEKKIQQLMSAPFDILQYPIHPQLLKCKIQLFLTLDHQKNALEQESQKAFISLSAKKEFFGSITHEFRTPLNAIIGMSELITSSDSMDEHKNYASTIRRSGELLLSMINTIIDYSKIKSGSLKMRLKPFQPRETLKKIIGILSVKLQAKHSEILENIDPKLPQIVLGDVFRFEQVIFNMLDIAIQQTINDSIILNMRLQGKQGEQIKLYISIEDENMDLSDVQVKSLQDGSDTDINDKHIGIAVTRHIVQKMDGNMGFFKSKDNLTEFWCTLTLEKTSQDLGICNEKNEEGMQDESFVCTALKPEEIRILLVEDNEINQILAERVLIKMGFVQVDKAQNGKEGVLALTQKDYDLVIMDINMPVMDGLEASRLIRSHRDVRNKNVTIIALTANVSNEFRKECLDNGINDYLSKPFRKEDLFDVIKKYFPRINLDNTNKNSTHLAPTIHKKQTKKSKKLPLFNKKNLLERLEGDEALYQELMQGFLADIPVQINKLEKALDFDDLQTAAQVAHTLKGAFSSVGAQLLQKVSNELEEVIKKDDSEKIKQFIIQLKVSLNQIKKYI
ncbi:Multi-sensor hybrid histidine kinase [Candidatus Magnetomorum sp. HK-1]|nr:Multi-sensor hybrid histidine kinase [Candidatus Magnetomorum sp. HK-1]